MSYHHLFDHLGRPLASSRRGSKPKGMHRLIQGLSAIVIVASLCILVWVR